MTFFCLRFGLSRSKGQGLRRNDSEPGGPESAWAYLPELTGSDTNMLAIVDDVDI